MKLSVLVAALTLAASPAFAESVRVVDGDTLKIDGVTYRLWGIDAPEAAPIVCRRMASRTDRHRTFARPHRRPPRYLRTPDPRSLRRHRRNLSRRWPRPGADMVADGHAWAFVRYSRTTSRKNAKLQRCGPAYMVTHASPRGSGAPSGGKISPSFDRPVKLPLVFRRCWRPGGLLFRRDAPINAAAR